MLKTLRPQNYNEVSYVGHFFMQGFTVVMDLNDLTAAEATKLVDFSTGLVVGRGGDLRRVAPRVFLLEPDGVPEPKTARLPEGSDRR